MFKLFNKELKSTKGVILCNIFGYVHHFISHCLIPLDPCPPPSLCFFANNHQLGQGAMNFFFARAAILKINAVKNIIVF